MTAGGLLEELRARGARITVQGDRLRVEAPKGVVSPEIQKRLRRRKLEILRLLANREEPQPVDEFTNGAISETREQFAAVRIRSRTYGEVWLARDAETAAEIAAEGHGLPILTFDEITMLRRMSRRRLRTFLTVKSVFSGSRLIQ